MASESANGVDDASRETDSDTELEFGHVDFNDEFLAHVIDIDSGDKIRTLLEELQSYLASAKHLDATSGFTSVSEDAASLPSMSQEIHRNADAYVPREPSPSAIQADATGESTTQVAQILAAHILSVIRGAKDRGSDEIQSSLLALICVYDSELGDFVTKLRDCRNIRKTLRRMALVYEMTRARARLEYDECVSDCARVIEDALGHSVRDMQRVFDQGEARRNKMRADLRALEYMLRTIRRLRQENDLVESRLVIDLATKLEDHAPALCIVPD